MNSISNTNTFPMYVQWPMSHVEYFDTITRTQADWDAVDHNNPGIRSYNSFSQQ